MAEDEHRQLWPGTPLPTSQVNFKKAATFGAQAPSQDFTEDGAEVIWADAAALPTSLLMSFMSWAMSHHRRMVEDRMHALEGFKQLMVKVFAIQSNIAIEVRPLDGVRSKSVHVDCGRVHIEELFGSRMSDRVRALWNRCRVSQRYPYLVSTFETPMLWEVVQFLADPAVLEQTVDKAALRCMFLQLFTICAKLVDDNAGSMSPENERIQLKEMMLHKNQKSAKRASFSIMLSTALALWRNATAKEDSRFTHLVEQTPPSNLKSCKSFAIPILKDESKKARPLADDKDWTQEFSITATLRANGLGKDRYSLFQQRCAVVRLSILRHPLLLKLTLQV